MQEPTDALPEYVTYVVVVHGIGEQRKNETVINVPAGMSVSTPRAGQRPRRPAMRLMR